MRKKEYGQENKNRIIFAVAENYRRYPLNRAIKRILEEKLIGEPYFFLYQWAGVRLDTP